MIAYSADTLRALNVDPSPPPRAMRKTLFSLKLWRPARYRRLSMNASVNTTASGKPAVASSRSADRSMVIGWLNCQSLRNKTVAVHSTIVERSLDVLALTETWHDNSADVSLRLSTPDGYAVVDAARGTGRGGGVAIVFRKHLQCSRL